MLTILLLFDSAHIPYLMASTLSISLSCTKPTCTITFLFLMCRHSLSSLPTLYYTCTINHDPYRNRNRKNPLVLVHTYIQVQDVFHSLHCFCNPDARAFAYIHSEKVQIRSYVYKLCRFH